MVYNMCVCDNLQRKQYELSKNSDATTQKRQNRTPRLQIKLKKKNTPNRNYYILKTVLNSARKCL